MDAELHPPPGPLPLVPPPPAGPPHVHVHAHGHGHGWQLVQGGDAQVNQVMGKEGC